MIRPKQLAHKPCHDAIYQWNILDGGPILARGEYHSQSPPHSSATCCTPSQSPHQTSSDIRMLYRQAPRALFDFGIPVFIFVLMPSFDGSSISKRHTCPDPHASVTIMHGDILVQTHSKLSVVDVLSALQCFSSLYVTLNRYPHSSATSHLRRSIVAFLCDTAMSLTNAANLIFQKSKIQAHTTH